MNRGFTLAEVLITLGIIGVLAALTVPILTAKYKQVQTENQLKKIYSTVQQSVEMARNEYGDISSWDWSLDSNAFFEKYLSSAFSVVEYCSNGEGCWNEDGGYLLNGIKHNEAPTYLAGGPDAKITLADGTYLALKRNDNNHMHIYVDINGNKKPNTYGRDIFVMTLTAKNFSDYAHKIKVDGLYMFGHGLTRNNVKSIGCAKNGTGFTCGELILIDSWKIESDYPW